MVQTALPITEQVRKNVFDRFYWDARLLDFANIDVEVEPFSAEKGTSRGRGMPDAGVKVTLKGSVRTAQSRGYAEDDVRSVPGVKSVDNRLAVKPSDNLVIPSDRDLELNVKNIIRWNSGIDSSRISVSVSGGFITLEGTVCSYYQKFRAQELAADVIGVTRIDNRLTVVPRDSRADEEIARNIIGTLKDVLGLDAGSLTVMVDKGTVTLTGTVPDEIAYAGAENAVRRTRWVVDLHNLMSIEKNGPANRS